MSELSGLFAPDRVAVVGGSGRKGAVGRAVSENLTDDFDGEVLPVDPNDERIPGRLCYDDILPGVNAGVSSPTWESQTA